MRLIHTESGELRYFNDEDIPPYAALSHTWGPEEVSYDEYLQPTKLTKSKSGYKKIQHFLQASAKVDVKYGWIDTCCINKDSSSELSEAINSMYAWYEAAVECLAYLEDVTYAKGGLSNMPFSLVDFGASRWFTRGWTLQELIAPKKVTFYSRGWTVLGTKAELAKLISEITSIPVQILTTPDLESVSVAQKMSWASFRKTTRKEDIAYCLLGLFGVHMPLIYGEGEKAFIRLQQEIIKQSDDHSIFLWQDEESDDSSYHGMLARHPIHFAKCYAIKVWTQCPVEMQPYMVTNMGLHMNIHLIPVRADRKTSRVQSLLPPGEIPQEDDLYIPFFNCTSGNLLPISIFLKRLEKRKHQFARVLIQKTVTLKSIVMQDLNRSAQETIYVRQNIRLPEGYISTRIHGFQIGKIKKEYYALSKTRYNLIKSPGWSMGENDIARYSPLDQHGAKTMSSAHHRCSAAIQVDQIFYLNLGYDGQGNACCDISANRGQTIDELCNSRININSNLSRELPDGRIVSVAVTPVLISSFYVLKLAINIMLPKAYKAALYLDLSKRGGGPKYIDWNEEETSNGGSSAMEIE